MVLFVSRKTTRSKSQSLIAHKLRNTQVAAFNIDEYLGYHHKIPREVVIPEAMPNRCIPTGRAELEEVDPFERKTNFNEVEIPMTPEEAMREAGRCLRCDHYGCGSMIGRNIR